MLSGLLKFWLEVIIFSFLLIYCLFLWMQLRFCLYHLLSWILFWWAFVYFSLFILFGPHYAFLVSGFYQIWEGFGHYSFKYFVHLLSSLTSNLYVCFGCAYVYLCVYKYFFHIIILLEAHCIAVSSRFCVFFNCVIFHFRCFFI